MKENKYEITHWCAVVTSLYSIFIVAMACWIFYLLNDFVNTSLDLFKMIPITTGTIVFMFFCYLGTKIFKKLQLKLDRLNEEEK